jgi:hypothetical protein
MGEIIGPLGAQGDLDALDGINDQQTQFPVENIEFEDLIEMGAGTALMGRVVLFEREAVGGQTIVVQMGEVMQGARSVTNLHAARNQQVELFFIGLGGFSEAHRHPQTSTPLLRRADGMRGGCF